MGSQLSLRGLQAISTKCGNSGLVLRKEEGLMSPTGHPHLQGSESHKNKGGLSRVQSHGIRGSG